MSTAQGSVEKIYTKDTASGTMFSVLVQEDGGDKNWYGWGRVKPTGFDEGDRVSFNYSERGNFRNADPKTVNVVKTAAAASAAGPAARVSPDARQQSIVMQSSQKVASELLAVAVEAEAIDLGASNTKAQKGKRYDALLALFDELTLRVYERSIDPQTFLDEVSGVEADAVDAEEGPLT